MAIGKQSDFKIYQEQFQDGAWEGLSRLTEGFNAASNGSIRLIPRDRVGNYVKQAFFKDVSGSVSRRDTTSVAAATDLPLTQDEFVSVKLDRKIGPHTQTLDALRKIGEDLETMSFVVGQMTAAHMQQNMIDVALLAVETAIQGQSAVNLDITGETTKNITHSALNRAIQKLGDFAPSIRLLVMHSQNYYDLVGQSIADNIFQVGGAAIVQGTPITFNRPVLVIDSPSLTDANASLTDSYNVLGLVEDAVVVEESEAPVVWSDKVTGLENLVYRIQGEFAVNLGIKGFKWDTSNGGANPTDGALGTTTNWDLSVTNIKQGPGVRLVCQAKVYS